MDKEKKDELFAKLWFTYPTQLCKGKRGGKQPARKAFDKVCTSEEEFNRIMLNMKAQIRNDLNDPDAYRWPFLSSYLNQRRFDDVIEINEKPVYVSEQCAERGCNNEVHGPKFNHCIHHLPTDKNDPILIKLREHYVKMGLVRQKDESKQSHLARCKAIYKQNVGKVL